MPTPNNLVIEQLNIEIAGGCNYKCQMCPQDVREKAFKRLLPISLVRKIIDDATQYGVKSISLHGSGEPLLHKRLTEIVQYVTDKGVLPSFFTNGKLLTPDKFRELIDAGLDLMTVSFVGYDKETYATWMQTDAFDEVLSNIEDCLHILEQTNAQTKIHTRHIIMDLKNKDDEIELYRKNIIDHLGVQAEIWMMQDWTGIYDDVPYNRRDMSRGQRSCGRPHAPYLEVRAGGINGHRGGVVPCPYVLGRDADAILGHLDDQTIMEVVSGKMYEDLRVAHEQKNFGRISYCDNCDMLSDVQEALAWSNIPGRHTGQSKTSPTLNYTNGSR